MPIYEQILSLQQPRVIVLLDPAKNNESSIDELIAICESSSMPFFLIGGSLVNDYLDNYLQLLKSKTKIPLVLFPGNMMQLSNKADAILLLSLISGRNPDLLIGNQVNSSMYLKKSGLEIIPTGYMLIQSGNITSVQYMSNTFPIPSEKIDIAVATAVAGEQLGFKLIYLEAGSGALSPVPVELVKEVNANIDIPLVVGGGIRDAQQVENYARAGAKIIVLGNSVENNPMNLKNILHNLNGIR
jgi:putative glycerol-1-phosphate prenyltransferase